MPIPYPSGDTEGVLVYREMLPAKAKRRKRSVLGSAQSAAAQTGWAGGRQRRRRAWSRHSALVDATVIQRARGLSSCFLPRRLQHPRAIWNCFVIETPSGMTGGGKSRDVLLDTQTLPLESNARARKPIPLRKDSTLEGSSAGNRTTVSDCELLTQTRGRNGLSSAEAAERRLRCGPNSLEERRRLPLPLKFLSRFRNPLVIILLVAAVISALTGDLASFVIISTIVLMSAVLDTVQEYRAEQAAEHLKVSVALKEQVLRDGQGGYSAGAGSRP